MANEAVKIVQGNISPRRMSCGSTDSYVKGQVVSLVDPANISGASLPLLAFGGIVTAEKTTADGSTSVSVDTSGIFDMVIGDVVTAGTLVSISGAYNVLRKAVALDLISGLIVGKCLETTTANEVALVNVGSIA